MLACQSSEDPEELSIRAIIHAPSGNMKTLVRQLLERAKAAGGEEWVRQCLASPLNIVATGAEKAGGSEEETTASGGKEEASQV